MVKKHTLAENEALSSIENGEFSSNVISSSDNVVVIMTQDWCPQWKNMQAWVYGIQTERDVDVYELVYNKADFAKEFMKFKEEKLGNDQIPYLRYYSGGKLVKESNYVNEQKFKSIIEG